MRSATVTGRTVSPRRIEETWAGGRRVKMSLQIAVRAGGEGRQWDIP
jgi:hypothetical protein